MASSIDELHEAIVDLDEALDDAEAKHDAARYAKQSAEREALLQELARATGLGGKSRRAGRTPTSPGRPDGGPFVTNEPRGDRERTPCSWRK